MSDRYGPLRDLGISDQTAQPYDCLLGQPSAYDANVLSAATDRAAGEWQVADTV